MRRSKKFIVGAVLAAVLLSTSLGAVAVAADTETNGRPGHGAMFSALWDEVATILQEQDVNVTPEQLKDAVTQARTNLCPEGMPKRGEITPEDMISRLDTMLAAGKITQAQYDNMKTRMESMPDEMPGFGFRGHGGMRGFGGPSSTE